VTVDREEIRKRIVEDFIVIESQHDSNRRRIPLMD
jgi:hypothetical protein